MSNEVEKFEDKLVSDLSWRKQELQSLKLSIKETENLIYTKSYILLLYAHWEGFIKKASLNYLDLISKKKIKLEVLHDNFLYLKTKNKIKDCFKSKDNPTLGNEIALIKEIRDSKDKNFYVKVQDNDKVKFIDTKSNLSADVFQQILSIIGINIPTDFTNLTVDKTEHYKYKSRVHLIDFLMAERNAIAHGDNIGKDDIEEIFEQSEKIIELLDLFISLLTTQVEEELYLK